MLFFLKTFSGIIHNRQHLYEPYLNIKPNKGQHMTNRTRNYILNPVAMLFCGLALGTASRLFDIYSGLLGNIFSELAIWILIGTLISIYSPTNKKAMLNILLFCAGMLASYYTVAIVTNGVYDISYIIGWSLFALLSPFMAYLARLSKRSLPISKIIGAVIVLASVMSSIVLFDGLRVYDFIIDGLLIYFIFFKKIRSFTSK